MHFKRISLVLIVLLFISGTLSAKGAAPGNSNAFGPWTTEIVDQIPEEYIGPFVSIDHYEHSGRAYISYYDVPNHNLKLAYQVVPGSGNCPGNPNWNCETVDASSNDVGLYSSIDVVEGSIDLTANVQAEFALPTPVFRYPKIGISYYDETIQALKFALRTCSSPLICNWTISTVVDDSSNDVGRYSSFQFENETTPVIFYQASAVSVHVGQVWRAKAITPSDHGACTNTDWTCEQIAGSSSSADYGTHISADGGRVVFYDAFNSQLIMAKPVTSSTTCGAGSRPWDCEVVDYVGDVGKFASMVYDGVHPMLVAYYDATNGKVKYAIQKTSNDGNCNGYGTGTFDCFAVDDTGASTGDTSVGISLTLDTQGEPVIAYQDFSANPAVLKLARPASVYGNQVGNCGDNWPSTQYWHCSLLDDGGQTDVNEADYVAISVNPSGLATVAYYESDENSLEGRLKVAQQHFGIYLPLISK